MNLIPEQIGVTDVRDFLPLKPEQESEAFDAGLLGLPMPRRLRDRSGEAPKHIRRAYYRGVNERRKVFGLKAREYHA